MGTAIVMASGKGGTGKSTASAAVASCLAALGHKTLCIDVDIGLKNLDLLLGLSDVAMANFADVLQGHCLLEDAVKEHPKIQNLFFLTAPSLLRPEQIDAGKMTQLIQDVKEKYDYCIIDCPAGIGPGFYLAAKSADMAIVVINGDLPSTRDGQRVAAELYNMGIGNVRLLINRIKPRLFRRASKTVDAIIDSVGAQLIGLVSEDDAVTTAADLEIPLILYENRRAAMQFLRIARRITGEAIPLGKI